MMIVAALPFIVILLVGVWWLGYFRGYAAHQARVRDEKIRKAKQPIPYQTD
jgi:hypothetical protein